MSNFTGRLLRPLAALVLSAFVLSPLAAPAQTAPSDMDGTWNAAAGSTAIAKAVIAHSGKHYTLHLFGVCTPTPCDIGTQPLTIFAPTVNFPIGKVGTATFNKGFVTLTVVVTLNDATSPLLNLQVFNKFAPGDTRSNYVTTQTMH